MAVVNQIVKTDFSTESLYIILCQVLNPIYLVAVWIFSDCQLFNIKWGKRENTVYARMFVCLYFCIICLQSLWFTRSDIIYSLIYSLNNLSFFRWQWTGFRCSRGRLCCSPPTTRTWVRVPSCTNRVNAMLSLSATFPKICLKSVCTRTPSPLTIPGTKDCRCSVRFWKLSQTEYQYLLSQT